MRVSAFASHYKKKDRKKPKKNAKKIQKKIQKNTKKKPKKSKKRGKRKWNHSGFTGGLYCLSQMGSIVLPNLGKTMVMRHTKL